MMKYSEGFKQEAVCIALASEALRERVALDLGRASLYVLLTHIYFIVIIGQLPRYFESSVAYSPDTVWLNTALDDGPVKISSPDSHSMNRTGRLAP